MTMDAASTATPHGERLSSGCDLFGGRNRGAFYSAVQLSTRRATSSSGEPDQTSPMGPAEANPRRDSSVQNLLRLNSLALSSTHSSSPHTFTLSFFSSNPSLSWKLKKSADNRKATKRSPVKAMYGDEYWTPESLRQDIWSIRNDLQVPSSPYLPAYAQGQGPPPMVQERFQSVISQLFQYRIIRCGGAVDDDMANIIVAQLLYLDAVDPNKDIVMYVNSPGGSVTAGMAIFDTMRHI
ncbi:ATP-dependent Clp protease proteolytic subunit 5 [Arachis hypogaea]|nr:ATP-dependent Clp protease proteolytic subunit 5 [Arachis hypogaea]